MYKGQFVSQILDIFPTHFVSIKHTKHSGQTHSDLDHVLLITIYVSGTSQRGVGCCMPTESVG